MPGALTAEMLALIDRIEALGPLPPVAALHLPSPEAEGTRDGEFCAVELADRSLGLSYVLLGDTLQALLASRPGASLAGMPARELAGWYADADPVRRTLGFAAVNAISQRFFRESGYRFDTSVDSIGMLDPQPGERIGMVGLFRGLVERIVGKGARLTVLELKPELAGDFDGWRVTLDPGELAGCDKILSTTTILLNDTVEQVLAACTGARYLALVGPGGGCLPDPLFARGVTVLGGTAIVDRDGFVDAMARGEPWSGFARKYCIAADRYPGFEALSAALRD
ncbi:DUF364 domain-containing protein [Burkholderiaceae bacterium FT117]|uniref:Rossmann-like domain-containing protein n=1 Tax=Zeimonas sediminis TaxID=2944268 RepID=UPI002342EFD1|nr:DUF364 domain-containing protein [Zeimonas sediminis]MCM5569761.1 DUF364 domain-containing protein [Zeimonas sediminis]